MAFNLILMIFLSPAFAHSSTSTSRETLRSELQSACVSVMRSYPDQEMSQSQINRLCSCIARGHHRYSLAQANRAVGLTDFQWFVRFYSETNSQVRDRMSESSENKAKMDADMQIVDGCGI